VILAVFLLIFVSALLYLIVVLSKAVETKPADLIPRPEGKNYVRMFDDKNNEKKEKGEKTEFSILKQLAEQKLWLHSKKRTPDSIATTDLMVPFEAARCPGCEKLIPTALFGPDKKCPLCGESLNLKLRQRERGQGDADKDGLPDAYEVKYKLDPRNPDDANADLDADGFTNLAEYKAKTNPANAKSHPPLAKKLVLARIRKPRLNVIFKQVTTYDKKDKKQWLLQIQTIGRRGWKTNFKKIGDILKLGKSPNDVYKILDVEYKMGEVYDPGLKQPVEKNISIMTLQSMANEKDEPIKAVIDKPVYENRVWVQLEDVVTNKTVSVRDGASFTVGSELSGKERYTLLSVDIKNKKATIENTAGEKFEITAKSKLDTPKKGLAPPTAGGGAGFPQPFAPRPPKSNPTPKKNDEWSF